MKKVLMGLAALPFLASAAVAMQPLTNQQLDRVTAGFNAVSVADAEGLAGESGVVLTTTATLSEVTPIAKVTPTIVVNGVSVPGEASSVLWKSLAASSASTYTSVSVPAALP
jgi:hypothetical protein